MFLFELLDLLLNCVVCKLSEEHLLLLIDELICILGTLLLGELHTASCDVHGLVNEVLLLGVIVALLVISLARRNVTILDSM